MHSQALQDIWLQVIQKSISGGKNCLKIITEWGRIIDLIIIIIKSMGRIERNPK